jgi:molecular chaperone HtpG
MKKGNLSIHTENIFPIIKKFLYSDQEVFLRELVSNAVDATQKLKTLASRGEFKGELGDLKIKVSIDKNAKTLTITDRGIGMTAEEVERYINQIAFSSAEEFLAKFKDSPHQIIGHFGLGFYSAFMVADKVEIYTQSYQEGAAPVRWSCMGSTEFELEETIKASRGTDVVLYIGPEHDEFLKEYRIEEILKKYCRFLPIEIEFNEKIINDTNPLWRKIPSEITETEYKDFYNKLYPFSEPPLFWVHLNVDYPFTLTGILYFPKIKPNVELQKDKIQLYANQVFITDNVSDIVPDYLNLLHGVLDSPDIPLNVSRSYLQTDSNVRKISSHISKKVADKLHELFRENRKAFEEKWASIGVFVKYGMIRDSNFYEKAKSFCLYTNIDNQHFTFEEYKEKIAEKQTNKEGEIVLLYTTDLAAQHTYIQAAQKRGYDVLRFDGIIDLHFIQYIEHRLEKCKIARVDSDTLDNLIDKGIQKISLLNEQEEKEIKELFENFINTPLVTVNCQALGEDVMPVTIVRPEHQRRMQDMASMGMLGDSKLPDMYQVVLNTAHPLTKKILLNPEGPARQHLIRQTYDLARLSQNMLSGSDLTNFIEQNLKLMSVAN